MTVFGALRIRNEGRWIRQVLDSILPLCERVFVLDDHSTDSTDEICEQHSEKVTLFRSKFDGLDETRDKTFLLQRVMDCVSDCHLAGNEWSPFWCLAIDGDEVMAPEGIEALRGVLPQTHYHAFSLPIPFLWNSDLSLINTPGHRQIRVDGVYSRFRQIGRPSLFRLMNRGFCYQSTPWGGNFHCSSIPQQLLHHAHYTLPAPLYHLGYNYAEDRVRKYEFYNSKDPNNEGEDCYRHMVVGDTFPAHMQFKHAGPLQLEMV